MKLSVPVIGILRGVDEAFFPDLMTAAFDAGLQAMEVTMNTEGAERIVRKNLSRVPKGRYLGIGTVRNIDEAKRALDSGAAFIVTPNTDAGVIGYARGRDVPVIAGAFSPTEVYTAWSSGACMVKVFPCGLLGPSYIRELRGPFDDIDLVAVGGVTVGNLRDYFDAGVRAVGASSALFGKTALTDRDLKKLSGHVKKFVEACPLCHDNGLENKDIRR
ncbi:MAG: bifunctional 4-hydroxy-2-oxoglutarate aldolase/2-dehydro-3-deoxy-phosphogluconate aldolase [Nitrospirae bacterium]|nr:bifunctional 4-hydroxy-2-oxoglutarate aldolase/2-dehydro-3-deoxy-phosphogluconate aldolase [Nitrospirota bacterium]